MEDVLIWELPLRRDLIGPSPGVPSDHLSHPAMKLALLMLTACAQPFLFCSFGGLHIAMWLLGQDDMVYMRQNLRLRPSRVVCRRQINP